VVAPAPARALRPPPLYRLARWFRRFSLIALIVLILFLASVGYSAFQIVRSSPQSGGYSAEFAANDTIAVTGSLTISNPGWYPLSGFALALRVENASGDLLGDLNDGPATLAAGATTTLPITFYLPIASNSPAESLLVTDQDLAVGVWGNATDAYLFPVSVHFDQQKSWGAPFDDLQVAVGTPVLQGGSTVVPVTISFTNDASFAEVGSINLALVASNGAVCGGASYPLNVGPGEPYDQTQDIGLSNGCSIAGGSALATFTGDGATIPLPPEALP
jgi:hypothetical protein